MPIYGCHSLPWQALHGPKILTYNIQGNHEYSDGHSSLVLLTPSVKGRGSLMHPQHSLASRSLLCYSTFVLLCWRFRKEGDDLYFHSNTISRFMN
jgi:hypothetical protein